MKLIGPPKSTSTVLLVCIGLVSLLLSASNTVADTTQHPSAANLSFFQPADTTPPAAIINLTVTSDASEATIELSWHAPGDDGASGTASAYILRYSSIPITDLTWNAATDVTGEPSPSPAGRIESMAVPGLARGQTYFFAIKAQDEAFNTSPLSNIASVAAASPASSVYLPLIAASGASAPVEIPDTTEVLADETTQYLSSVSSDGTTFTFAQSTTELQSLAVGDIIVSDGTGVAPYGFLRKVNTVSTSGGQVIIQTEPATLEEAIESGSAQVSHQLKPDDVQQSEQLPGVTLEQASASAVGDKEFYLSLDNVTLYELNGEKIKVDGEIILNPGFDFSIKVEDFKLREFSFAIKAEETTELELSATVEKELVKKEIEIARYHLKPIVVMIGSFPVVMTPVLSIHVGLDGTVKAGIAADTTQEFKMVAGIRYAGQQWTPFKTYSNNFSFDTPRPTTGANIKTYAGAQLAFLLYGAFGGPYAEVNCYFELEADTFDNPWWTMYVGLEVPVGVKLQILGRSLADYESPAVIGYRRILAQAQDNSPLNKPFAPLPTVGAANQPLNVQLSWSSADFEDDALTYDVYFEAADPTPDVLVSANQSGLAYAPNNLIPNTSYYWQIVARDEYGATAVGPIWGFTTGSSATNRAPGVPANPSPLNQATEQATNLTLTWSGSDPDGDALTYDVYFEANDPVPDVLAAGNRPAPSFTPGLLQGETPYYWRVVASDIYGHATAGPVWTFTTGSDENLDCIPPGWVVTGAGTGQWGCQESTIIGHSSSGDSLLLAPGIYTNVTLSATVSSPNREASLAVRLQDEGNGYIVIFLPDGISWNDGIGGIWIAKRVNYQEEYLRYYHAEDFPTLGQSVQLAVTVAETLIQVSLDNEVVIQATDSTFGSGQAGLRVYGDVARPCDATFANVSVTSHATPTFTPTATPTPTPTSTPTPTPTPTSTPTPTGTPTPTPTTFITPTDTPTPTTPPAGSETWTTYTDANNISSLVLEGNDLWAGTTGGVARWNRTTGSYTKYTTADGLVHNNVYAIAIASAGDKWFGTEGGVSKFDGSTWTTYTVTNSGLANNKVMGLATDSSGNVWIGTFNGGVSKFDGSTWTTYTTADGLANNQVQAIAIDSAGDKWFGTNGGGVSKFDGSTWTTYTTADGLANDNILAIAIDSAVDKWFGTWSGVSKFDGSTWTTYTTADGLAYDQVSSIAIDSAGDKWFGTWNGVSKFDGSTWTTYTTADGLAGNYVRAIAIDSDESKWFGTSGGYNGISKFDGSTWTTYTTADGPKYNHIKTVTIDSAGDKWFGTDGGGVSKFDGSTWTTYTTAHGLASNQVQAIAIASAGDKWFGTNGGGVSKFDGSTWTTYTTADGLANNQVQAIAIDSSGNKWFGTYGGGVSKFDGSTWTTYTTVHGLANNSVTAIAIDSSGNKWFGTYGGGVSKFDGLTWTTYTTAHSLADNSVTAIAIDSAGSKWFGTQEGVSKFDGSTWTTYTTAHGLASNYVFTIAIDSAGDKWFGTWSGVSKFDGSTWTTYTTAHGLADYWVSSIAIDSSGNKWFGTYGGGVSKFSTSTGPTTPTVTPTSTSTPTISPTPTPTVTRTPTPKK